MATTNIKRSTSASRLINYAEKRAVQKDGHNIQINYAKTEFKQVREVFGNSGSTQAYASRLAFSPDEFNPLNEKDQIKVLEIAKEIYSKAYLTNKSHYACIMTRSHYTFMLSLAL